MKKISVITINYNNLEGLKRTIPSVLTQTYNDYEYLVIDGGSTDGSKEYIESQQGIDYWISEKDKGIYNAMNKAVKVANGEYCIFMNSGDHFFSTYSLGNAAAELDGTDYCVGQTIEIGTDHVEFVKSPSKMSLYFIVEKSLQHQSTFIKTQLLKDNPYDENFKIVADWKHFFENWYFNKISYKAINKIVSVYYLDGFSAQNVDMLMKEREQVVINICGRKKIKMTRTDRCEYLTEHLKGKIKRAMKLKPLARDWKIMRNGFKAFFKDLFL